MKKQIALITLFSTMAVTSAFADVNCDKVHLGEHLFKDPTSSKRLVRFSPMKDENSSANGRYNIETLQYDDKNDVLIATEGYTPQTKTYITYAAATLKMWSGTCTIVWEKTNAGDIELDRIMSVENGGDLDLWGDYETSGRIFERKLNDVSDTAALRYLRIYGNRN